MNADKNGWAVDCPRRQSGKRLLNGIQRRSESGDTLGETPGCQAGAVPQNKLRVRASRTKQGMVVSVWEWTADSYGAYPYSPKEIPVLSGEDRVVRGGTVSDANRVTRRIPAAPSGEHRITGFRRARSA